MKKPDRQAIWCAMMVMAIAVLCMGLAGCGAWAVVPLPFP